jgi:hypothetical protein
MSKETSQDNLAQRAAELRTRLLGKEPRDLATYTATLFNDVGDKSGEFRFPLWGREVILTYPALQVMDAHSKKDLPVFDQTMVLYYFSTCDGTPMAASWIAFSELPDGRFYNQAFQGYTGRELAKAFGNDLDAFEQAARNAGGEKRFPMAGAPLGDAAYAYQALPRVTLLVVYWLGDEDFPPNSQILFDAAVRHHMPTDACAILGSTLTRRLLKKPSKDNTLTFRS